MQQQDTTPAANAQLENDTATDLLDDSVQEVKADLRKFNKTQDQVNKALAALSTIKEIKSKADVDSAMVIMKKADQVVKLVDNRRVEIVTPWNNEVKKINAFAKDLTIKIPIAIKAVKDLVIAFNQAEEKRVTDLRTAARKEQITYIGFKKNEEFPGDYRLHEIRISEISISTYNDDSWDCFLSNVETVLEQKRQKEIEDLKKDKEGAAYFGDTEEAGAIDQKIDELKAAPAPAVKHVAAFGGNQTAEKVKGITKTWTHEILNETEIPREYLCVDEARIKQAIRDGVRDIPGVKIFQKEGLSLR